MKRYFLIALVLLVAVLAHPQLDQQKTEQLIKEGKASRLIVNSDPSGAHVYIDGTDAGATPAWWGLLKKDHPRIVVVKMAGFRSIEKQYDPDGKDITLFAKLEKEGSDDSLRVTVKGHTLGESPADFAKVLGVDLSKCAEIMKYTTRKEAKKATLENEWDNTYPVCTGFTDALNGSSVAIVKVQSLGFYTNATDIPYFWEWGSLIQNHKLVEFAVKPNELKYTLADIVTELASKYGKPSDVKTKTLQNGYGAKWEVGQCTWILQDGTVIVASDTVEFSKILGTTRPVTVHYYSKERVAQLMNLPKKPSALD